jgi:hypothetical protein
VHCAEPGSFRDGAYPAVSGASFETLAVAASKDGVCVAFADGEVDGPRGAWYERDGSGLVALAEDPEGAVSSLEAESFDVGCARFANSESVESEQYRKRSVVAIEAFRGEQERAQFRAVHAVALVGVHSRSADVLGGVEAMRPST